MAYRFAHPVRKIPCRNLCTRRPVKGHARSLGRRQGIVQPLTACVLHRILEMCKGAGTPHGDEVLIGTAAAAEVLGVGRATVPRGATKGVVRAVRELPE